jgi:hypothetical protein
MRRCFARIWTSTIRKVLCVYVYVCVFVRERERVRVCVYVRVRAPMKNTKPRCMHSLCCRQNGILTVIIAAAAGKHLAAIQTQLMEVIKTQGQTLTNTPAQSYRVHM